MDLGKGAGSKLAPSPTPHIWFRIPLLPPSMNAMYSVLYKERRVVLKYEVVRFKSQAKMFIPSASFNAKDKLKIDLVVNDNWFKPDGKIRRCDAHNLTKVLVDTVAEKMGFDDSQVWSMTVTKNQSSEQSVDVLLNYYHGCNQELESGGSSESGDSVIGLTSESGT